MKNKYSELKKGALLSYSSIVLNIASGLLVTPWMIQQIGQSDYGIYTLVMSVINLFLFDFGMSSTTSRFIAKYRVENDQENLSQFLIAVYKIYFFIDALILCIFIYIYFNLGDIYSNFTIEEIAKIKRIFCVVGFYSIVSFPCTTFNGILTAYESFVPLKMADIIQRIVTIVLTIIALLGGLGLYALILANIISGLISILFKVYFVKKNVSSLEIKKSKKENSKKVYSEIAEFSLWGTIFGLTQRLIFNITPSILGIVLNSPTAAIAVFGIVTTIEGYIFTITTALNGMFLTRITRIVNNDSESDQLTKLAINVGRFLFVINGLIIVGFALVGKDFIMLWMGKDYIQAYYGILLVIIPGLFYNSLQIAHTTMVAQNFVKYQAYVQIFIGISNVIISLFLSKRYGVIGACVSICTVYVIRVIMNLIIIRKKIDINLKDYMKKCYLKMSIPLFFTLILGNMLIEDASELSWGGFCIKGLSVVCIYIGFLYLTGLSRNERKNINAQVLNICNTAVRKR